MLSICGPLGEKATDHAQVTLKSERPCGREGEPHAEGSVVLE